MGGGWELLRGNAEAIQLLSDLDYDASQLKAHEAGDMGFVSVFLSHSLFSQIL